MSVPTLGPDWSSDVQAFIDHWHGLREDAQLPTSETFLDSFSPAHISRCYIAEFVDDGAVVRFHGTALVEHWGIDLTGHDMHGDRPASFKSQSMETLRTCVSHPCGYVTRVVYSTSKGRKIQSEILQLPLAVKAGRAHRFVCHATQDMEVQLEEVAELHIQTRASQWIDLGAGVPEHPPLELSWEP